MVGGLAGTSDFSGYAAALRGHPTLSSLVFLLALIGFGSKAGIVPAHVWLPEAHPVAPSHASALMSGAMIKVGIYGLVRVLTVLGTPPAWWGWLLIAAGVSSGVLGVLFALAQHDLKRLLAYHSVENIGIILIGIGLGVLGLAQGMPLDLQGVVVSRRRCGPARRREPRTRGTRRALQADAVDRNDVPDRLRRDRRAAAAQRLRQRIPALLRGLPRARSVDGQHRGGRVDLARCHGADQRIGRGMFRQGLRRRVPRLRAQPRGG